MLYPSVDELVERVGSKYTLVVAASKRARKLRDEAKTQIENPESVKFVGVALEEIDQEFVLLENIKKQS